MKWAGHLARGVGEGRGVYRLLVGKTEGKRLLGRSRRRWDMVVWTGRSWLRIGTVGDICKCGKEPSCSIKCEEFLENWLAFQEGLCSME
jgi:hypothetical protein